MGLDFWGQIIGFSLSIALGVLTTQIVLNCVAASRLFTFFVAWGMGMGLSSAIWFMVWCRAGSGSPLVPLAVEFLALFGLAWLRRRIRVLPPALAPPESAPKWLALLAALSVICAGVYFVRYARQVTYGGWDGVAIWNLHARAFFQGGGRVWKTQLWRIPWSHPDYPLSIPLNVARLWFLAGYEAPSAPACVAFLFTFGTAGVLATGLAQLKGWLSGVLALTTLLASTTYLWYGVQEYADIPQSFYLLTALVTIALYERTGSYRYLILAGLSCGLAVWTKNEGWLFASCLIASQVVLNVVARSWNHPLKKIVSFASGGFFPVSVALIYKWKNPAHSDVVTWSSSDSGWNRVVQPDRLWFIFASFGRILWNLDTWLISSAAVLVIYAALIGLDKSKTMRRVSFSGLLTIGLMLAGYFCVYATSPTPLREYLRDSLDRLYIQLWPSFVFCLFLATRTPGEKEVTAFVQDENTISSIVLR